MGSSTMLSLLALFALVFGASSSSATFFAAARGTGGTSRDTTATAATKKTTPTTTRTATTRPEPLLVEASRHKYDGHNKHDGETKCETYVLAPRTAGYLIATVDTATSKFIKGPKIQGISPQNFSDPGFPGGGGDIGAVAIAVDACGKHGLTTYLGPGSSGRSDLRSGGNILYKLEDSAPNLHKYKPLRWGPAPVQVERS